MLVAPSGARAFINVERWTTVRAPLLDTEDRASSRDAVIETMVVEIDLHSGKAQPRLTEDGWVSLLAYAAVDDVLWLAADRPAPRPRVFGVRPDRTTIDVPAGFAGDAQFFAPGLMFNPMLGATPSVLWEMTTGRQVAVAEAWPLRYALVRVSADGAHLTGCDLSDGTIRVGHIPIHDGLVAGLAHVVVTVVTQSPDRAMKCVVTPDGSRVAVASDAGAVVYDVATRAVIARVDVPAEGTLAFAGPNTLVVRRADDGVMILDLVSGVAKPTAPGCCRQVVPAASGNAVVARNAGLTAGLLIAADRTVTPLSSRAGAHFAEQTGQPPDPQFDDATRVVILPDRARLVIGIEGARAVIEVKVGTTSRFRTTVDAHGR
ncbi:MAG: hypothetical protein IPL61_06870 [Myxococcales bacterium]|nr:hypothetical protein [Myxococcales bacterium]